MSSALFEIDGAGFSHGERVSLHPLSFEVLSGQRIALLGANGSGKTTLLRLLAGLLFPSEGAISYRGTHLSPSSLGEPFFRRHFRRQVGIVFQHCEAQLFCPTVEAEIAFGPQQLGLSLEETLERVRDMLGLFRLEHLAERYPGELSGGEGRKVALAAVLAIAPDVLLLDEPTAGLDPRSQLELRAILVSLGRSGKTLITATHELEGLELLYDRVLVLSEEHRLVWAGSPGELSGRKELLLENNLL